jgi:excisionase family DNA binding protein
MTLGVREAALRLGFTQKYVRDLLYEGKLPGARKEGREWRIPITTLERRLRQSQGASSAS